MDSHMAGIAPGVQKSLQEKGQQASALRTEALAFLKRALAAHPAPVFRPLLPQLLPAVLTTVEDRYYKVSAEALRVCTELVRVIRSSAEEPVGDRAALVPPLFSAVLGRLQATEQDQEVKEAAITCMGNVIAALGDAKNVDMTAALPVLLDRLQNEITRQTAAKAFSLMAVRLGPASAFDTSRFESCAHTVIGGAGTCGASSSVSSSPSPSASPSSGFAELQAAAGPAQRPRRGCRGAHEPPA